VFPHAIVRYGDLDKPETLTKAFNGGQALFLLSPHGPNMVQQQVSAIEQAAASAIKRIVKISGTHGYICENSPTDTGRDHWRIEQTLENLSEQYVILRCNFFMQNLLEDISKMVRNKKALRLPFGRSLGISFLDARDIGSCALQALAAPEHANQTYYLTGPESSFGELADILSKYLDTPIAYRQVPLWLARIAMRFNKRDRWTVQHQIVMAKLFIDGAGTDSTSAVETILGRPPITLERFTTDYIGHFQQ